MWYSFSPHISISFSHISSWIYKFLYKKWVWVNFKVFFPMLKLNLSASLTSRSPFMFYAISFDMPSKSDNLLSFWHKRYPRFTGIYYFSNLQVPLPLNSPLYNFGTRLSQCCWTLFTFKPFLLWELVFIWEETIMNLF